jgi:hypothetical protein
MMTNWAAVRDALGIKEEQRTVYKVKGRRARLTKDAAIREGFKKGVLVEDLCRKCTYISRFDGKVGKINPDASPRAPDPVHGN